MTPERYQQVGQIYRAASDLESDQQAVYLAEACAGDESLRQEVESLLCYQLQSGGLIDQPILEASARAMAKNQAGSPVQSSVGQIVGHYRMISLLGKGGMGEVWLAEDTRLGRKIAIKLLPSEFTADAERVRRFAQEAHAASALNHPNIITIHEIGVIENTHYIVTEYVEGQTLRQAMDGVRMELREGLDVTLQVARALEAAHVAGIVHRDIKPENIMVRPDGYVKVLDFGIAKLIEPATARVDARPPIEDGVNTESGVVMGTPRCMSPEQARGEKADARTDIFSLGIVFYEMITGRAPFTGATRNDVIASILKDEPPPLAKFALDTPPELQRIVNKTLQKNLEERYQAVSELLADLKLLKQQWEFRDQLAHSGDRGAAAATGSNDDPAQPGTLSEQVGSTSEVVAATSKRGADGAQRHKLLVGSVLALIVAGASWLYWRNKMNQAQAALPRIEEFARAERFFEAYDLAVQAQRYLPNNPTLMRLLRTVADDLTVVTDPPGAQVYLKRFTADASGKFSARQLVNTTPIHHQQIARGAYVVSIEKQGYGAFERTVTGGMLRIGEMLLPSQPIRLEAKLAEAANVPPRMAFVPGGDYRLVGWSRPTAERVRLDDYLIDKYEVTNREYKEFINARGYLDHKFWKHKFIKDDHERSWAEALREFKDQTGLPGPRSWRNQEIPEGKAEHPVADITWYEAAAYAAFRGKELPTVFQWEKAARNGLATDLGVIMPWGLLTGTETLEPRANFGGPGTLPVESLEFGQSPFGCYQMAGNVAEWCRNQFDEGFATTGGSWGDPPYQFSHYGTFPGSYSSSKLGFRCVRNAPGVTGDQGAMRLRADAEVPVYKPVGEASFRAWKQQYYRYAQPPLDAQVVEVKETEDWRREKITYVGAEGERAIAYLYLPKHHEAPWHVIQYIPPGDTFLGITPVETRVESYLPALIKSGRALLAVVLKGFQERAWPPNSRQPAELTVEYREMVMNWMTDERRALDYVATRSDLDASRVAYVASSSDRSLKLGLPAVEPRYRAVIWLGACLRAGDAQVRPEIHPPNLIPYIRAPKLFVHGRYDEGCRLKSETEPLIKLLSGPKRVAYYDGGHIAPPEFFVPTVNSWLDETMGSINHQ